MPSDAMNIGGRYTAPTSFVVTRQDTHVGSYWLSLLLSRHNISTFFEHRGECPAVPPNKSAVPVSVDSLRRLFASGCGCLDLDAYKRRDAYCKNGCTAPRAIEAPVTLQTRCKAYCRQDAVSCIRPDCSACEWCNTTLQSHEIEQMVRKRWRAGCQGVAAIDVHPNLAAEAHRQGLARVIAFGRANVAKRAVSSLKLRCRSSFLDNHATAKSRQASVPTLLWLHPNLFLRESSLSAEHREHFIGLFQRSSSAKGAGPLADVLTHRIDYEDLQADSHGTIQALLAAMQRTHPLSSGDEVARSEALATVNSATTNSETVKSSDDDLRRLVLNLDAINASAAERWPCLLPHLLSRTATSRLPGCGRLTQPDLRMLPLTPGSSFKTIMVHCEKRRCVSGAPGFRARQEPSTDFETCFRGGAKVGMALCERAQTVAARRANVCVRTSGVYETWLRGEKM